MAFLLLKKKIISPATSEKRSKIVQYEIKVQIMSFMKYNYYSNY